MATQKKIDSVAALTDKLGKSRSVILTDYAGIKHKQLEELRKKVKEEDGEYAVVKNTLFARALGDQAQPLSGAMKNVTGVLFSYRDEVSALKAMKAFFKTTGLGSFKAGLLGNTVLTKDEVEALSALPPKEALLAQLAGQLQAPVRGLHYALSWNLNRLAWALGAIKEKKQ